MATGNTNQQNTEFDGFLSTLNSGTDFTQLLNAIQQRQQNLQTSSIIAQDGSAHDDTNPTRNQNQNHVTKSLS